MQEHRTQAQTRDIIIQALLETPQLTRSQIARLLNRKKSPHLNTLLNQLVGEGILSQETLTFHNGVIGYVYALTDEFRQAHQP